MVRRRSSGVREAGSRLSSTLQGDHRVQRDLLRALQEVGGQDQGYLRHYKAIIEFNEGFARFNNFYEGLLLGFYIAVPCVVSRVMTGILLFSTSSGAGFLFKYIGLHSVCDKNMF